MDKITCTIYTRLKQIHETMQFCSHFKGIRAMKILILLDHPEQTMTSHPYTVVTSDVSPRPWGQSKFCGLGLANMALAFEVSPWPESQGHKSWPTGLE